MRWRWLEHPAPLDPWKNMRLDEECFEEFLCCDDATSIVRVYRWDRDCVTYGRLQSEDEVRRCYSDLPLVRRPTGGRAVRHGSDLTFSVVTYASSLPIADRGGVLSSYRVIIAGLVKALQKYGIMVVSGDQPASRVRRNGLPRTVDCFATAAGCDLVDINTGQKLVGSAQRRVGNVILQQMSLQIPQLIGNRAFIDDAQRYLADALAVSDWESVDSHSALCYTNVKPADEADKEISADGA